MVLMAHVAFVLNTSKSEWISWCHLVKKMVVACHQHSVHQASQGSHAKNIYKKDMLIADTRHAVSQIVILVQHMATSSNQQHDASHTSWQINTMIVCAIRIAQQMKSVMSAPHIHLRTTQNDVKYTNLIPTIT